MTGRRIMGIETEYGITVSGDPAANPVTWSGRVVLAYASTTGTQTLPSAPGWDYADESPLRDARGFEIPRLHATDDMLTDVEDPSTANTVLTNGARLYVDHAHPEYSSPETTGPLDAVRWDRAGERVVHRAATALQQQGAPVRLYKNNTDGKGASYGTHENYLVRREVPFPDLVRTLLAFFPARQVLCGAGRVGLGVSSERPGFQISQRADFMETEVGLETTLRRPLVNTRDEPHANADTYRRLHVILGDATHADVATLLQVGTTSLVLGLVERGVELGADVELLDPVRATHLISHDPDLTALVPLRDGRAVSALDLLEAFRDACAAAHEGRETADPDGDLVLAHWTRVLDLLRTDPSAAAADIDWVAKRDLLQRYRDRDGLAWDDARLAAIDLQWSDVDPARGLAQRLRASGRLTRLVPEDDVESAVRTPPEDTRAWFRGECVRRYPRDVRAASWDSVVLDGGERHGRRRIALPDPWRGTREQTARLLDEHPSTETLLDVLASTAW